jgi:hypothetical protein
MLNISKIYHPKNEHLNANVKNCQYMSPKFIFLYISMAQEGSQNIQNNKMRSLTYVMTQLRLLEIIFSQKKKRERERERFCEVHMSNETSINYQ